MLKPQRPASSLRPPRQPLAKIHFNKDGQFYTESAVRAIQAEDRAWPDLNDLQQARFDGILHPSDSQTTNRYQQVKGLAQFYRQQLKAEARSGPGCRKLQDTALMAVIKNLHMIHAEDLEGLQAKFLMRLWRQISRRCLANFTTWKAFSKLVIRNSLDEKTGPMLPSEIPTFDLYKYEKTIYNPVLPLSAYTKHLISPSFDFITVLSISETASLSDLVKLSKLKNLGALHLMCKPGQTNHVSDQVIRAWSEVEGSFPVLRVLRFWGIPGITSKAFEYATKFPALGLIHIRQCSNFATSKEISLQVEKHGWKLKFLEFDFEPDPEDFPSSSPNLTETERYREKQFWDEERVVKGKPQDEVNERALMDEPDYQMGNLSTVPWKAQLYNQFHLLGRMRGDEDLAPLGRPFPALCVDGVPIPPIPIARLHIGDSDLARTSHDPPDVIFLKPNYTSPKSEKASARVRKASEASPGGDGKLRPRKKMKFDSLMNKLGMNNQTKL